MRQRCHGDSRVVPVLDPLLPILNAWKLASGGEGLVIQPLRTDGKKIDKATPGTYLRAALAELKLEQPGLGWYEATRHTFASQWVMSGGSIEKLKEMLGHYSVVMTGSDHRKPRGSDHPERGVTRGAGWRKTGLA